MPVSATIRAVRPPDNHWWSGSWSGSGAIVQYLSSFEADFPRFDNLLGVTESFWRGLRGFGHGLVSWALAAPGMRTTEGAEAAFRELQQKMVRTSARRWTTLHVAFYVHLMRWPPQAPHRLTHAYALDSPAPCFTTRHIIFSG